MKTIVYNKLRATTRRMVIGANKLISSTEHCEYVVQFAEERLARDSCIVYGHKLKFPARITIFHWIVKIVGLR